MHTDNSFHIDKLWLMIKFNIRHWIKNLLNKFRFLNHFLFDLFSLSFLILRINLNLNLTGK